jgi:hypothetical protein
MVTCTLLPLSCPCSMQFPETQKYFTANQHRGADQVTKPKKEILTTLQERLTCSNWESLWSWGMRAKLSLDSDIGSFPIDLQPTTFPFLNWVISSEPRKETDIHERLAGKTIQ